MLFAISEIVLSSAGRRRYAVRPRRRHKRPCSVSETQALRSHSKVKRPLVGAATFLPLPAQGFPKSPTTGMSSHECPLRHLGTS